MDSVLLFLTIALISFVILKILTNRSTSRYLRNIPGPTGWPLFGNILSIKGIFCHHLYETSKKYGPIFKFRMGCRDIVILSSYEILSKTFKDKGYAFSGRWQNVFTKISNLDSGIMFKDKEFWSIQRDFLIKILSRFGFGKSRSNEIVNEECAVLIQEIEDKCNEVVSTKKLFTKAAMNVISKFVMNIKFKVDDQRILLLSQSMERFFHEKNFILTLMLMYPILESFPLLSRLLLWCNGSNEAINILHAFFNEIIDERKKRFYPENEGEDLIDMFLKEQYRLEKNKVQNHTFTHNQLIRVSFESFAGGSDSIITTLTWAMVLMAKYTEIQDKVYQELLNVIGSSRMINMNDKLNLIYSQAVIDELYRFSSMAPLASPHRVLEDTEIDEYFIPKDTIIYPNLYACHRDNKVWERPFEFYPQHFLTTDDKDKMNYVPRDELIPFGIGKRQCFGESLGRMEVFVYFTNIIHRFHVRFDKEMDDETFEKAIKGTEGLVRAPLISEVVFQRRDLH